MKFEMSNSEENESLSLSQPTNKVTIMQHNAPLIQIQVEVDPESLSSSSPSSLSPISGSSSSPAVFVDHLTYSYESSKRRKAKKPPVLNDISIHVAKSLIYALLGSSGCGKTTLLRCIIGRLEPQLGSVKVFNRIPNSIGSDVPGAGVGYMPQELALISQFTMTETFKYYGTLYQMSSQAIQNRIQFLLELLDLTGLESKFVDNLSGGQKRRVSLAIALIHNPPLLILDEPTVGVDPLLRETIWKYLVRLTHQGLSVIITTHYIEEARAANVVGFMRNGRMLVEDNPLKLMRQFMAPTLEKVFLMIARRDSDKNHDDNDDDILVDKKLGVLRYSSFFKNANLPVGFNQPSNDNSSSNLEWPEIVPLNHLKSDETNLDNQLPSLSNELIPESHQTESSIYDNYEAPRRPARQKNLKIRIKESAIRIYGLCDKNRVRLLRRKPELVINIIFPALQVALFFLCMGRDPKNIPVSVCNQEQDASLSKMFLESIDSDIINLQYFDSPNQAIKFVEDTEAYGAIIIPQNYSDQLIILYSQFSDLKDDEKQLVIEQSTISVYLDASNALYAHTIRKQIYSAMQKFAEKAAEQVQEDLTRFKMPLKFGQPIYGTEKSDMIEFMGPGMIVLLSFFGTTAVTSIAFLSERREGSLERTLVAGASPAEFIFAQVLIVVFLLASQLLVTCLMGFWIFEMPMQGNYFWAISLLFLQGICGMCYGLMISSVCTSEISAVLFGLGLMLPTTNITGMFWPVGTMPTALRYLSYFLPHTFAMDAFRNIVIRGFGPSKLSVLIGFLMTGGWISVFLLIGILVFKNNK